MGSRAGPAHYPARGVPSGTHVLPMRPRSRRRNLGAHPVRLEDRELAPPRGAPTRSGFGAKALAHKFGHDVVTVGDSPGFVTSRILAVLINEAARIVSEGIASPEDVDKACRLGLGHTMGPLATVDLGGIQVITNTLKYLREELGDSYRPCPLLTKKVLSGELGRKTGRGFFDHSQ